MPVQLFAHAQRWDAHSNALRAPLTEYAQSKRSGGIKIAKQKPSGAKVFWAGVRREEAVSGVRESKKR